MRHVHRHTDVAWARHQPIRLHIAVQRIREVVRAVDEQDRHATRRKVLGRIVERQPFHAVLGGHLGEVRADPVAVVAQESASVDRHGRPEAIVQAGDDAGQIAAPRNAGERRSAGVDFGQAPDERMGSDNVRHRVVRPALGNRLVQPAEFGDIRLVRSRSVADILSAKVHRDGRVAAFGPQFRPFGKRGAAAAMHQNDGRERGLGVLGFGQTERCGRGVQREDSRGSTAMLFAGIGQLADTRRFVRPLELGRLAQFGQIPGRRGRQLG